MHYYFDILFSPCLADVLIRSASQFELNHIYSFIHSLYVHFGNTFHIKIVQIMHRSCKLILKDVKKNKNPVLYTV